VSEFRPLSRTRRLVVTVAVAVSLLSLSLIAPAAPVPARAQDQPPPVVTVDPAAIPTLDPANLPTLDPNLPTVVPEQQPLEAPTAVIEVEATPEPTDPPAPPPRSDDPLMHIVQVGESLNSLAAQSGFSVNDLAERNSLTNPNILLSGQKVRLPTQPSSNIKLHRVSPGETLSGIAAQYGVSPFLLRTTNRLACSTCVVFGQMLRVPQVGAQAGAASTLPEPFQFVEITPNIPRQGDVIAVRVQLRVPLQEISGTMAGRPLRFTVKNGEYMALSGVAALQEPGVYPITIRAITENGTASVVNGRVQIGVGRFAFENLTVGTKLVPLLEPQVNVDERAELDTIFNQFSGTQYWQGPFQWPVRGKIVSYYGTRRNFNRGTLRTFHAGIDLPAPVGTPIKAAAPGRVAAVQPFKVRGNVVILDHGRGVFTIYCHLSKFNVQVGQIVNVGDVIGYAGNTGRSLGPHLHFELAVGGVTVNPLEWMEAEIP
jgi:murein DD-endopeptidase MepM/ murein hydrolase activator NlpD